MKKFILEDSPQVNEKIIKQPQFESKFSQIKSCPLSSLVIIADYDDTFTKAFIDGTKTRTSFVVIDSSKYVSDAYRKKANDLSSVFRKYETDVTVSKEKRISLMEKWYNSGLHFICEENISRKFLDKIICDSVENKHIIFRNGTIEFFELLIKYNIPLIIISAGIKDVLIGELKMLLNKNYDLLMSKGLLHIIGNEFIYENDVIKDYIKPAIFTFNKSQFINEEVNKLNLKGKKNILFFGDHMNDIDSIKDLKCDNVLSLAFYNVNKKDIPKEYFDKYDCIVTGDGDFSLINGLVVEFAKPK